MQSNKFKMLGRRASVHSSVIYSELFKQFFKTNNDCEKLTSKICKFALNKLLSQLSLHISLTISCNVESIL